MFDIRPLAAVLLYFFLLTVSVADRLNAGDPHVTEDYDEVIYYYRDDNPEYIRAVFIRGNTVIDIYVPPGMTVCVEGDEFAIHFWDYNQVACHRTIKTKHYSIVEKNGALEDYLTELAIARKMIDKEADQPWWAAARIMTSFKQPD